MNRDISGRTIDVLLAKLGSDDSFRAFFTAEPAKALATLGISLATGLGIAAAATAPPADPSAVAPALDATRVLASKEAFQQARLALRDHLSPAPFVPITLDFKRGAPTA